MSYSASSFPSPSPSPDSADLATAEWLSLPVPPEVTALIRTAKRLETPCGDGSLVWHVWGTDSADAASLPLVLLHGGSGSWTHWVRTLPALIAAGRKIYVPDLPGFGDSAPPPAGQDADAMPGPLEEGLQILLGDGACELVGFSFGGMVAGFLAECFPERVSRLVILGAPGLGITPAEAIHLRAWRHLQTAAEREAVHRHNLGELMLYRPESINDLALGLHTLNVLRDRMPARRMARTNALALSLRQLQCPVYAIYGGEDALFRGKSEELKLAWQQAPGFQGLTLIPEAGHWVQFEQAEAFNQVLLALLSPLPSA